MQLAKRELQSGRLDAAIVYGVDPIGELSVAGFHALGAQSKTLTSPLAKETMASASEKGPQRW